jgi:hypothetical protein
MAAVGAHELATGRVLVPVGIVAVAAAAGRGLAQLVELEGAGTAFLVEAGGAAGAPVGEAREEDLVPEEGEEEDGDAGEARGGAAGRRPTARGAAPPATAACWPRDATTAARRRGCTLSLTRLLCQRSIASTWR